jgi:hypothetical protein
MQLILRSPGFVRNFVLLGEPRTQIDEPAAVAAERPVRRCRRPFDIAPARRTFDYRCHPDLNPTLSAAGQLKRHISCDVDRTRGSIQPIQKANGAAMLAGAHFGK